MFYGPFDKVKKTVVGAFLTTRRFPFVAKVFLSDKAIDDLIRSTVANDPTWNGEQLKS